MQNKTWHGRKEKMIQKHDSLDDSRCPKSKMDEANRGNNASSQQIRIWQLWPNRKKQELIF